MASARPSLRLATRGSPLARWQAEAVATMLRRDHPGLTVELVAVETEGDRRLDRPVWELGGQGVFVKEVQAALLDGRADAAVHSAKDLPSQTAPGLALAAVPRRGDPRDVLIGATLAGLGPGALVATGSVRRRAQMAWLRPDLTFAGLRGNIATRLERVPPGGAIVMAAVALERLGLAPARSEILSPSTMVPQVGQGALAVECRAGDDETIEFLLALDHADSSVAVRAERAFLSRLGGGCDLPVGAYATVAGDRLEVHGLLASLDGRMVLRDRVEGATVEAHSVGEGLAARLLAAGGSALMADAGMGAV